MRLLQGFFLFVLAGVIVQGLVAQETGLASGEAIISNQEQVPPPLPRWREGGTPYDPDQPMQPYAIELPRPIDAPTSGLIASPPEYGPTHGVLFMFMSGNWHAVVVDCVAALTGDPDHDEIAYVVVTSSSQQSYAENLFSAAGADLDKVEFIIKPAESIWIRDYGPHFIWQAGTLAIVDSHYYPGRWRDNFTPTQVGDDYFQMATYDMGLYYSGGNFLPGPARSGHVTALINADNSASQGFTAELIAELYSQYQGIDTLHIFPQLPPSVDGTGHIDMWMNIVDADTVIISEFQPGSNETAIQITDDAVVYMEGLGYEVFRTPAWNARQDGYMTHYTYTNAFRVNDRVLVSTFGEGDPDYLDEDAAALATWQAAAGPEVELLTINCYPIIWAAGAIHCIVMQVPRYTAPEPAVHVIWPQGGELLVGGTTQTILWAATDTHNAAIPQVDLYYSTDDGDTYDRIDRTTDTGSYEWTVPEVSTTQARIKIVVTAGDLDQAEGISAEAFQIALAQQHLYDFSSGAGVDKKGYGYQAYGWSNVDGLRHPVPTEISSLVVGAYDKIAYSDATGNDYDQNRYISPDPSSRYMSTHTFEFLIDEDVAELDDVEILWEGYADDCAQVELYVWDYVDGQWGDAAGLYGQNRFADNWAGNWDGSLSTHIRADFERYIDVLGQMTVLTYVERDQDQSFHDYMRVIVSTIEAIPGDLDGDGCVDQADLGTLLADWGCTGGDCPGDCDGDGDTDQADLGILLSNWGVGCE
jgi:agmatine deiminase